MASNSTRPRGRPKSHGMAGTPTYTAWAGLRARCNNVKHSSYFMVGGKGIRYAEEFETFQGFLDKMGVAPVGTRLKRRDTNKNFTPDNCYWSADH